MVFAFLVQIFGFQGDTIHNKKNKTMNNELCRLRGFGDGYLFFQTQI